MSRHKTGYVISYHGILCHEMSYDMTVMASLILTTIAIKINKEMTYEAI